MSTETEYFRMSLAQRKAYRAPSCAGWFYKGKDPRFQGWKMVFRPTAGTNPHQRLTYLEAGHGLRVLDCTPALTHRGWYADQFQSDTIKPALILLPHGRAIPAAADPWNDDALTLFRGGVLEFPGHDDVMKMRTYGRSWRDTDLDRAHRDAINRADRCTELLAEDYRDDFEHQQKLHDLEEARDRIKRMEEAHATRVEELTQTVQELEEETQAENVCNYPRTLARVQKQLEKARAELQEAQDTDPAEEEREAARQLEQETARPPRFNYFQND